MGMSERAKVRESKRERESKKERGKAKRKEKLMRMSERARERERKRNKEESSSDIIITVPLNPANEPPLSLARQSMFLRMLLRRLANGWYANTPVSHHFFKKNYWIYI